MKDYRRKILLITVSFLAACSSEPITPLEVPHAASSSSANSYVDNVGNQIIVHYTNKQLTTVDKDSLKYALEGQFHFDVLNVEYCDCESRDLELWTIGSEDPKFIGVEGILGELSTRGEDDMDGDQQFTFPTGTGFVNNFGSGQKRDVSELLSTKTKNAVKIAIIDTGIDYDFLQAPVLYDSRSAISCQKTFSGWNFSDDHYDIRDEHGHGTVVSQIIMDALHENSVEYELLPLKAFDHNGNGSYWNVLCALNFLKHYASDVAIANLSFGWGGLETTGIMNNLMEEMNDQILFIASAGNKGLDTDAPGFAHFPSGYEASNLLTIGGYKGEPAIDPNTMTVSDIFLHRDSNYGRISIDMLAPFDEYEVTLTSYDDQFQYTEYPEGTSFGTAFATAQAAEMVFLNPKQSPKSLKKAVIASGYRNRDFRKFTTSGRALTKLE